MKTVFAHTVCTHHVTYVQFQFVHYALDQFYMLAICLMTTKMKMKYTVIGYYCIANVNGSSLHMLQSVFNTKNTC